MKKKIFYRVILFALILFFGLQFLSQTFLIIGERKPDFQNLPYLKLSSLCFPIDARPLCEYGFALLKKQQQFPGNASHGLEASIDYLKKSFHVNMLYYQAHFYLGNAYLYKNIKNPTHLDQAVEAFKRAAQIRGYRPRLSMDVMKLLLSLWPLLREEDKTFCTDLLNRSLKRLAPGDFNSLLETWGLYSQDVNFFKDALKKRPEFYLAAAQKMLQLNIHLEKRQEFLSNLAACRLSDLQNLYRRYLDKPQPDLPERLKQLFSRLMTQPYIDYHLLKPGNKFNQKDYYKFKKRLNLHILELLFSKKDWQKDLQQRAELRTFIHSYIDDLSSPEELNDFSDFLEREKYFAFSEAVFGVFYIEQLLKFKSGQYDTVISKTEDLRKSVYVKTEDREVYSDILLLLTDAYISSDLLIQALEVLKKIEITASNLTEIYWRKMRIEDVIGPEDEKDEKITEQKSRQYELIRSSRWIELSSHSMEKTVYLIDNNSVEIQLSDSLKRSIKSFHLFQVFINGRLFYEAYPGQLTFPIKISLPVKEKYSRFTLNIKILR
ncbi:MAG: hypothetical protein GTO45_37255 [Candidatus Aminicenantes bacterium]|nr:hypothetical protein [Candidatus Aminicenantes bacterium]NIM84315.1 hypothetical protein [Candidatus Aminicenantes bacterium]NIN23801.1 hypothetical protein [Candidatus Aminicenantes bacterium]NIN47517.1 hypothetical protein [Candidatus Aminicenantes bacterium]NIN90437.1 hypothetical protein [Candidatus Aminicenantes bacterium]